MFWILLDKIVEELTRFSSVKQLVRFLKQKVGGKASRKVYTFTEEYPLEQSLSQMSTPKKLRFPEARVIEGVDQDGARLSRFCVVLLLFFES